MSTDKQYKAMESCYLSVSAKLLTLQVEYERLQIRNKALTGACEEALSIFNNDGEVDDVIRLLEKTLKSTCPPVKKMV